MIECGTHSSFLEFGSNAQAISRENSLGDIYRMGEAREKLKKDCQNSHDLSFRTGNVPLKISLIDYQSSKNMKLGASYR